MPDLNSEIQQWVDFAKGDFEGHPFRGNQYATESKNLYDKADNIEYAHNKVVDGYGLTKKELLARRSASRADDIQAHEAAVKTHTEVAQGHRELAEKLRAEQQRLTKPGSKRDAKRIGKVASIHESAAWYHDKAAEINKQAAIYAKSIKPIDYSGDGWQRSDFDGDASDATATAKYVSEQAHNATLALGNITKSFGFQVMTKTDSEILKGDTPGHAFHGNQWTSLGDKAGAIRQADKSLSSRSTPEELRQVAQWHRDIASQHQTAAHQHEEMPHLTSASEIGQARYDALRSHAASEMGKHDAASYLHNKAAGELELAAKLKEEHLPSGSYGVLRTAQHTGKQAFSASSAVESHPVGDPEFADHEKAQMGSDLAELGKSAKTITDWRKENNSPGAHPIEAKPAFVPYTPPATPDEPMPAGTSGTSGTDYGQSDDFSKAIAIWKAKQDPRYTTINVSPDHMEDWGHQGWNGVDENGVVRDAHDLDESSEEPGQMPIMGVVE